MSITTTSQLTSASVVGKNETFQDLPIISRSVRLNIVELENSDRQVLNELVYRCCRIITRKKNGDNSMVLIIDTIGSVNPIRLATVLKRDSARLLQVHVVRQCKINSTFVTLSAYLKRDTHLSSPKLIVVYHDEFYVIKTLNLLKEILPLSRSQFIVALPRLNRQARDVLSLMPSNQILRCDFVINRREIAPAPPDGTSDSYQKYLNQVYFQRYTKNRNLPERIEGELREDGLHLHVVAMKANLSTKAGMDTVDGLRPTKKHKPNLNNTIA